MRLFSHYFMILLNSNHSLGMAAAAGELASPDTDIYRLKTLRYLGCSFFGGGQQTGVFSTVQCWLRHMHPGAVRE